MKSIQQVRLPIFSLLIMLLISLVFVGCKELTNNAPNIPVLTVNVQDIAQQLGVNTQSPAYSVQSDAIDNDVASFAIGAIDTTSSGATYDASTDPNTSLTFEDDITSSISAGFIQFINVSEMDPDLEYVEFYYPKTGESQFQVGAVAFGSEINSLQDAIDGIGSVMYIGFDENPYTADSIDSDQTINLTMQPVN